MAKGYYQMLLITGIKDNTIKKVKHAISKGASVNFKKDEYFPLELTHDSKMFELLVQRGANVNLTDWYNGETLLHRAISRKDIKLMELLIFHKADINKTNELGKAPLHLACAVGDHEIINFLLRQEKINQGLIITSQISKHKGLMALDITVDNNFFQSTKVLLEHGANPNGLYYYNSCPPLHRASLHGNFKIAKVLINYGASVNLLDINKETPIYGACRQRNFDFVKFLVEKKGAINICNNMGNGPLMISTELGCYAITEFLIKMGGGVNLVNFNGQIPLHIAALKGYKNLVDLLLLSGSNVKGKDTAGANILHYSVEHLEIFKKFVDEHKISVKLLNNFGQTPLHTASLKNGLEVVKFLIERKMDVNAKDDEGRSPLLMATNYDHYDMVELLFNNGADLNLGDRFDYTPLYIALNQKNGKIVEFLVKNGAKMPSLYVSTDVTLTKFVELGKFVDLLLNKGTEKLVLEESFKRNCIEVEEEGYLEVISKEQVSLAEERIKALFYKSNDLKFIQNNCHVLAQNLKIIDPKGIIFANFKLPSNNIFSLKVWALHVIDNSYKANSLNLIKLFSLDQEMMNFDFVKDSCNNQFSKGTVVLTGNIEEFIPEEN
jgi:ankyrin